MVILNIRNITLIIINDRNMLPADTHRRHIQNKSHTDLQYRGQDVALVCLDKDTCSLLFFMQMIIPYGGIRRQYRPLETHQKLNRTKNLEDFVENFCLSSNLNPLVIVSSSLRSAILYLPSPQRCSKPNDMTLYERPMPKLKNVQ